MKWKPEQLQKFGKYLYFFGSWLGILTLFVFSFFSRGEEITMNYHLSHYLKGELKNLPERKKLCQNEGFVCSCELCKEEEINNDNEIYKKFQNVKDEADKIKALLRGPFEMLVTFELIEKVIACQKQMYNLAKNKKAPKMWLLVILHEAFYDNLFMYGKNEKTQKCWGIVYKGSNVPYFIIFINIFYYLYQLSRF